MRKPAVLALWPEKLFRGSFVRGQTSCISKQKNLTWSGLLRPVANSASSFAFSDEGYFGQSLEAVQPRFAVAWWSYFELPAHMAVQTSVF